MYDLQNTKEILAMTHAGAYCARPVMDPEQPESGIALPTDDEIMLMWDLTIIARANGAPESAVRRQERDNAVKAILDRQEVIMRRIVRHLMFHGDVDDALQESRLRVARALGPDIDPVRFPGLVTTITRNTCLTLRERLARQRGGTTLASDLDDGVGGAVPFDPPDPGATTAEVLFSSSEGQAELLVLIAQFVATLDDRDQAIWNGIHLQNKKAGELARELQMQVGNVYVRLSRMRKDFGRFMESKGIAVPTFGSH